MLRKRTVWLSILSSVNTFCFDISIHTVIKLCSNEASVNVCLSDEKPEVIGTFHMAISSRLCNGVASVRNIVIGYVTAEDIS